MEQIQYLSGADAIDVARLTGLQLHRNPAKAGVAPDTDWRTADFLVMAGASPDEFFIDLGRLSPADSADIILSLIGMWKASHDLRGD